MHKLTKKQKEVLDYIVNEINYKNYPPSVREICAAFNLKSSSTAHSHLVALEKKGYIKRDPTKPRALELLEPARNFHNLSSGNRSYKRASSGSKQPKMVPLIGTVTAGLPILAEENIEDYLPVPDDYLQKGQLFILRVKGDSMIGAGILDGDLIVVRQQQTAENAEIVVALLEDEATVKRIYKENSHIRLVPENDSFNEIITRDAVILGKVVGLFRWF